MKNFATNFFLSSILLLTFIHIFAHFIPFERMSVSADDLTLFLREKIYLKHFLYSPDRPLQDIWLEFQTSIIQSNGFTGLLFTFFSSLILVYLVYLFLLTLLNDLYLSFILTIIYSLIFSKLEIFHTPIMVHIIIASSIYILSLISFIFFINYKNNLFFLFSLIFYLVGCLWYEVGFFLPLFVIFYLFLNNKIYSNKKMILIISSFLLISFFYLSYRMTGAFGYAQLGFPHTPSILKMPLGLLDVFNHFFGRSFFKNIIYGFYGFYKLPFYLLFFFIIINFSLLYLIVKLIKKYDFKKIDNKFLLIALSIFIIFLIPNILNGSVAGRNLIISSIGFSFLIYFFIFLFSKNKFIYVFSIFFILGMMISQGNSWNQVISLRINNSVDSFIEENKKILSTKQSIVFDLDSFTKNIKYQLINNPNNLLNTYFGAQTFEDWGLTGLVSLHLKEFGFIPNTYISAFEIIDLDDGFIKIFDVEYNESNKIYIDEHIIKNDDTLFIINYDIIFGNSFNSIINLKKINK